MIHRFDADYELDTGAYELRRNGQVISVERQVFDVLAYLVENRERLVSKEELLDQVWGDRFVSDAALNSRVMAARKAIGDSGKEQRLIKTVHGRGYRFAGLTTTLADGPQPAARPETGPTAPHIQYARTSDGSNIAFWVIGKGYPLLHSTGAPFNHVQVEWTLPDYRMWFQAYQQAFQHIRFDARGSGMSSRGVADLSVEAQCRDIIAVADRAGAEKFALQATQASTLAAIRLAVAAPDRVSHLVLVDSYVNGREYLRRPQTTAFRLLMETDWPLFTRTVAHIVSGDWSAAPSDETAAFLDACVDQQACIAFFEAIASEDVTNLLDQVTQPTLVLHHQKVAYPSLESARILVSGIPNATLVVLLGTWQEPGEDIAITVGAIRNLIEQGAGR